MAFFSDSACEWTAVLYRLIEAGAEWPDGTQCAKAAFLEKDGAILGEVMSFRVLLIMATLYRKWASMRLKTLDGWINEWELPEIYAGAGKQGAEDAWYQTMIDLEYLRLDNTAYCGGTADIMKFFD